MLFNTLKVESLSASLPPDIPLPACNVIRDVSAVEEAAGDPDVLDNEEVKDIPAIRPEEEDVETAEEEDNQVETDAVEVPSEGAEVNEDAVPNNNAEALQQKGEITLPNNTAEALQNNNDVHDPNGRMPKQLPTEASAKVKDYHSIKKQQRKKLQPLLELR